MNNKAWYLIYTKPRQEKTAFSHLERQQFDCYLPMLAVRQRQRMEWVDKKMPMFPRYLFIHLDAEQDNWSPIRSTVGVANLVRFGGVPAQVPRGLIQQLQTLESRLTVPAAPEFKPGDAVRILDGVMAGYEGIIDAKNGKERVSILLDIAGRHTRLQISCLSIDRIK